MLLTGNWSSPLWSSEKMTDEVPVIQTIDLVKKYPSGETEVRALNGINLKVLKGEFVLILGKSGSGKSTLISVIAGLVQPTEGRVEINGERIDDKSEDYLARFRRKNIGIVFQFFNLHEALNALENVELPMFIAGIPRQERRARALKLLEEVGLSHRVDHWPYELSGGERQRVGIARAFAMDPAIILADEPTGDLDSETGQRIIELFLDLNQKLGKTIVMVTHDESLAREGMRIIHMLDGKIISDTGPQIATKIA